jgi:hypothetical protein
MFYPLYPIGIGAEWWLLYRAIGPAAKVHWVIPPIFYFCLMLYVPGKFSWRVACRLGTDVGCRLVPDVHVHDQAAEEDAWWPKQASLNNPVRAHKVVCID